VIEVSLVISCVLLCTNAVYVDTLKRDTGARDAAELATLMRDRGIWHGHVVGRCRRPSSSSSSSITAPEMFGLLMRQSTDPGLQYFWRTRTDADLVP